ncbi:GntR family transcriptional regulator [Leifsonia sp. NPDC056665]|uniref:GntR family transcriptional regulator n=1 Tax=Leifsonia sp. NPDC056665 TaxID=3345901 RepID=UPI0036884D23
MPLPENSSPAGTRPLAREHAYYSIREAILNGSLQPGERLEDAALQRWLGVSRTPIRQALLALTQEGFIETARQAHTRVVKPRPQDAGTYLQAVGALVMGMTIITLPVISDAQRTALCDALQSAGEAISAQNTTDFIAQSTLYWATVTEVCPNPLLRRLVEQSATALGYNAVVAATQTSIDWERLRRRNQQLLNALKSGDSAATERATRDVFGLPLQS